MQRQYLIVKPNATPKEIQEVIENKSENGNAQIFAKQVVNSGQKTEAKRALQDIQDRHTDIIKLEKSIMELNQLFMDMSVLVAAQGELLNQIDSHVESAVDNTNQAADEMKNAVTIQRASRKKIMIIIGIGFCAVVGGGICLYVFA
jgi:t-SNARE complex subunit (syntaxin)